MDDHRQQLTRRLPSLRQYLGAEPSGAGFEEWAAATIALSQAGLSPAEARFARLLNTFIVACVEQMNREVALDPSPEAIGDALGSWSRAAGYATIMAVASVAAEGAPLRPLARSLAEDFKHGAKLAADAVMRDAPDGEAARRG